MSLPIFTDEAIYTRWSQIARYDPNWRFISLTDGKQPSFVWLDMIIMKFFSDPLMAGRFVSVLAGFITLLGIYFLTKEIFKDNEKKQSSARIIGLIACSIFVLFPFSLVYDRMALYESLVACFFVWALYFQILLVRYVRLDIAMILGFVLGGAVLTKSSGFLSMYLTPFLLPLFDFKIKGKARLVKFALYAVVGVVIANVIYSVLRLSPFYHIINEKNSIFVYSVKDWLDLKFLVKIQNFVSNFNGLSDWFVVYLTLPLIFAVVSSFVIGKSFFKEKIVLLLWFLVPFILLCVFGKTLYPRYILFMVMPLLPLVAYLIYSFFEKFRNIFVRAGLVLILVILPLRMDYYILFDFAHAPIPRLDLEQFINGWPAGGGIKESVEYFKEQAKSGPIYIATQGTFGLMPFAYEIYFRDNHNVTTKGYWPTNEKIDEEVEKIAMVKPTYFVFYQDCSRCKSPGEAPATWPIEKIASYKKGIGTTTLTVYKVSKSAIALK